MRVGVLFSSFDMLNVGDLDVIRQIGQVCDDLQVVVLSDETVDSALGRPPVVPLQERLAIVASVRGVSGVLDEAVALPSDVLTFATPDFHAYLADRATTGLRLVVPSIQTRSTTVRDALVPVRIGEVA